MSKLTVVFGLAVGLLILILLVCIGCQTVSLGENIGIVTVATYIGVVWGVTLALLVSGRMGR